MHKLDQQLAAGIKGDFDTGWKLSNELMAELPRDDVNYSRAKFNRGWYFLRQGKLSEGHKFLDAGRFHSVFGNRHIGTGQPIWNNNTYGTVLLNLEGGLGDQIHGFRFAREIEARGNKVVVACAPELAPIFSETFISVHHQSVGGIYHDYWLPSMSAIVPLGHEYKDLVGKPYIRRSGEAVSGRVGVRWSGNPTFEHEQHRLFPDDLMFDAVRGFDCVSLQRDAGADLKPDWMAQADLSDWRATRKSVSECELVITSCTSVAHLAAAMGVPTWIVTPILPYYLWALPGEKTPYYGSVTLFRQTEYGDWSMPFQAIRNRLESMPTMSAAV